MELSVMFSALIEAFAFSLLGIFVFVVTLLIFEKVTPYSVRKEIIDEHNTALAIILAAVAIGISLIIAMAHG
ncbi:MAG: DUF350 domain-containing protein [Bacteroidia bacterium]